MSRTHSEVRDIDNRSQNLVPLRSEQGLQELSLDRPSQFTKSLRNCLKIAALSVTMLAGRDSDAQDLGGGIGLKANLDLPYNAVGEAEEEEDPPEVVVFYGQTLEADGFFYAVDRSGSMQDSGELARAKQEIAKNIAEFSNGTDFAVVFFDANVLKFPQGGNRPADGTPAEKAAALSWIGSIPGGAGSCVESGLSQCIRFAQRSNARRKVIVYVGDGGGTCPTDPREEAQYHQYTLDRVRAQLSTMPGTKLNTLGISPGPLQELFLRDLARQNNGTYREI